MRPLPVLLVLLSAMPALAGCLAPPELDPNRWCPLELAGHCTSKGSAERFSVEIFGTVPGELLGRQTFTAHTVVLRDFEVTGDARLECLGDCYMYLQNGAYLG